MGYDLSGDGGYVSFNATAWGVLLKLARAYGWVPADTVMWVWFDYRTQQRYDDPPADAPDDNGKWVEDCQWEGSYDGNDGQEITDLDGRDLAEALEKALVDIPDEEIRQEEMTKQVGTDKAQKKTYPSEEVIPLLVSWSGKGGKKQMREAIEFFRADTCFIH